MIAESLSTELYELAEGPVWDPLGERLLWVDIPTGRIMEGRLRMGALEVACTHTLPGTVGAAVPGTDGSILVAARDGFAVVGLTGVTTGPRVLPEGVASRFNDGKCDPAGRFLAGSLALDGRTGEERLYRLESGGRVSVVAEGLTVSNGLGWSPDGRTMYHVDSRPGVVWAQPYDPETGRVGPRRAAITVTDGLPDGLSVDVEGNLWLAVWGAGQVRRLSPDGRLLDAVSLPVPKVSSAAFVGETLVVTTAGGGLFAVEVGVAGVPTTLWRPVPLGRP
ncbi:SMP-30/gluconolactonase/LRE family protein [Thermoactinospora rubra]|uniref:SMP-30/gluconolactonase/LRE family protein n=1 Tax=Thermoactinospora rubra TaxID=1088767 RepID=UPI000A0FC882|nr:SMP-30/gluconolactonase/LRE family protein [Thermoactinospora rubra]